MIKAKLALTAFLIVVIAFYPTIHVVNNSIAQGLENQLLNCELPPHSELIDSASVAGKMLDNGNGMQWFGFILIRSGMSEDMLLEWYNNHLCVEKNDMIYVIKQETPYIFEDKDYQFKSYTDGNSLYQIQLYRNTPVGTEPSIWESILNFDLRGH